MDRNDLSRANVLAMELSNIEGALSAFDAGEKIRTFQVGMFVVSAEGVNYPPQMVDGIKQALIERETQIQQELNNLGLTGMVAR